MGIPMSRLDGYKWLVEHKGLQLIKLQRKGKAPVRQEKGWSERKDKRSFEDVNLNRLDNAGVLTGRLSGVIVLDIDEATLFPEEYEIPNTFTVRTGKGFHHYYKLPDDKRFYSGRARKASGFDIRAEGGYVVAPWSTHPDGPTYTIVDDLEIADAPQWLLDLSVSSAGPTSEAMEKVPVSISITRPTNFEHPKINNDVLENPTPKGKRSEQIWKVLHELVEIGYPDEHIFYIFESNKQGIGEKYYEKGAGRVSWLRNQLAKVRKDREDWYADLVEAKDQAAVDELTHEILATLKTYKVLAYEPPIRAFVNLLIAMYEGSVTGWYAIPIPVGGGKTQTLYHFVKFLYDNDLTRTFPICLSFEKIEEIEEAARWLRIHGVPETFFQVVHHEVPNVTDVIKSLPNFPVVLHTHQKHSGSSYVDQFFKYKGGIRKLLIYDESMLNALIHSDLTKGISSQLTKFTREYKVNEELSKKIPEGIYRFFKDLDEQITKEEESGFRSASGKERKISPDISGLLGHDYRELVKYSRIIAEALGETDLYRTLLLAAHSPAHLSSMSIVKDQGNPAILVTKEILDTEIENLVTTDASREFRRLFRYTQRTDGKKVRIYNIENPRWNEELVVKAIPMHSGRDSIKKAFEKDPEGNAYLDEIVEIVKNHFEWAEQAVREHGEEYKQPKFLIFYPKAINLIPPLVQLRLIKEGLVPPDTATNILKFETFGRETATYKYKDCNVIIFLGLNHKPRHSIMALLAGEGFVGDPDKVLSEVEAGEFLQQLQQGIGRGTLRKGERQNVYFFHPGPGKWANDIQKAFPMSLYNGNAPWNAPCGPPDGLYSHTFEPINASGGEAVALPDDRESKLEILGE